MLNLTENEAKVMDFLVRNVHERNSINELGRKLQITHTGVHKILRKLEGMLAVKPERIGNAIYYHANLDQEEGLKMAEFVLTHKELNKYSKVIQDSLEPLQSLTFGCILFGSVLRKGRDARDIDIMLIIEKKDFKKVHQKLEEIREINPKRIHDLMMTKEDLVRNIQKKDEVVLDILKTGQVFWGSGVIMEAINNGTS